MTTAEVRVEVVSVEVVRPLRREILRAGLPASAAVYPGDDDPRTRHYAVRDESGKVVAIGTSRPEDRRAGSPPLLVPGHRVRGIAVVEPSRRRGLARAVYERMLAEILETEAREIWANVRVSAVPFAVALGLEVASDAFDMPDLGPHQVMARPLKRHR